MMKTARQTLLKELQAEGVSVGEARELADIAERCADLGAPPAAAPAWQWRRAGIRIGSWVAAGALGAATVFVVVAAALGSLPGQPVHPVKRVAEQVALTVDPALRPDVMMDKSWEVQQLTSRHRSESQVLAALTEYNHAFQGVSGDHYAAWNYCANELRRASADSQGGTKAAIDASLASVARYQS